MSLSPAWAAPEIKRLSPILGPSKVPAQCRVTSVLKDTPAEKAGIALGDILETINGQTPADAPALSELVSHAPEESAGMAARMDRKATTASKVA